MNSATFAAITTGAVLAAVGCVCAFGAGIETDVFAGLCFQQIISSTGLVV